MQNRTLGIALTILTAFICGCMGLFSCIFGGLIASGTPFDVTTNGITAPQTFPPTAGFVLLCLSLLFILIPVAVGFFALRKRDQPPL
jgi:hypothetical protein